MARERPPQRTETPDERADRNFEELLAELRVMLTGVQVLFSLLLTVPFSARFEEVTELQKDVYFAALLLSATSSICLIAPVAYHRMLFHQGEKPRVVRVSSRLAIAGLVLVWLAITSVLLLVSDVLFDTTLAVAIAAAFGALTVGMWFVPPLVRRLRTGPSG